MSPRLFDRLAAAASVLILIGLGMVSYYFAKQAEQNHGAPAVEGRPDPDFFVEQMTLMRADANGNPSVRVEADHMLHYPLDQRMAFTRPRIISLDETQPPTTPPASANTPIAVATPPVDDAPPRSASTVFPHLMRAASAVCPSPSHSNDDTSDSMESACPSIAVAVFIHVCACART